MIKLSKIPTTPPKGTEKDDIKKATKKMAKEIAALQYKMLSEGKRSILIIFQGMDSSGKDGATKNVFSRCSPSGVSVTSFKKPTDEEFAHDFLWRVHQHAPAKGQIKIFNRSHYEDILVQKVHGWITPKQREMRMAAINSFENLLQFDNNTTVIKFYMHLSKDRQLEKLQERIDDSEKNWKHNDGDWEERELWNKYRSCYEYAINNSDIPWHIVPVDSRSYRDYCIAKIVLETLKKMKMVLPPIKSERFKK
jgi:PPK2 family polyphosphate:nucleotide phosphotransferase